MTILTRDDCLAAIFFSVTSPLFGSAFGFVCALAYNAESEYFR